MHALKFLEECLMTESVRLSKRVIELTGCSRREAEMYIQGGWVRVDGKVIDEPLFQLQGQHVELMSGAVVAPVAPVTLLIHARADQDLEATLAELSAANHWADDSSGIRRLNGHFKRLKCCMPLYPGTSGLQVLTQDRHIERKLTEDLQRLEQEFVVEISGTPSDKCLDELRQPVRCEGVTLPPCKVSRQNETRLRFAMKNPQPGQIEFLCSDAGLSVVGIKRIRIGGLPMSKLALGQWRYLSARERF